MDIIQYITEQLYSKQEVVLSGFGKFIGQRQSAYVDLEKQKIYPPSKSVTFVRDTKSFDLDLAIYVARKEMVTEDEAAKAINRFVAETNAKLEKGQPVILEGIGLITASADGKISFKQSKQANLLPETFGMEPIELNVAVNKKAGKAAVASTTSNGGSSLAWLWWLLGSAAVVLLLVGLWWFFLRENPNRIANQDNGKTQKEQAIKDSLEREKALAMQQQADSLQQLQQTVKDPKQLEAEKEVKASFDTQLQNKTSIYLVVGSFKDKGKADELVGQLRNEGYSSDIIQGENGYLRVTIGQFPNSDEAMVIYNSFIEKYPERDIWAL